MLTQPLQKATKQFGHYDSAKNELLVRKGRKTHRFIFGDCEIRVVSTARPEVVVPIAPDTTIRELEKFIIDTTV